MRVKKKVKVSYCVVQVVIAETVVRGESSVNAQMVTDRLSEQMLFSLR